MICIMLAMMKSNVTEMEKERCQQYYILTSLQMTSKNQKSSTMNCLGGRSTNGHQSILEKALSIGWYHLRDNGNKAPSMGYFAMYTNTESNGFAIWEAYNTARVACYCI
ncbi:MAG: hypothetical protein M3Y53_10775 [Thermoproteota archaeon]|nr:hypothetical protein [Thermoproteota archaeon]